jgi:hypothetical protein
MADTRTTSPEMGNPHIFKTVAAPARMPIFSTATALLELWEKSSSSLSADELAWFAAGAALQVFHSAQALGAVFEETAVSDGRNDLFLYQLKTIEGLAGIAVEAGRAVAVAHEGGAA